MRIFLKCACVEGRIDRGGKRRSFSAFLQWQFHGLNKSRQSRTITLQQTQKTSKKMGNKSSQHSYGLNPTLTSKLIESQPGLQIYQSPEGTQYERYIIPCDPGEENTYKFRVENQHPQIIDIFYAGLPSGGFNCSSTPNIVVVTERVPYRLSHLPPQQLVNAVVILRASLLGFRDLFKFNGILCVRDSMIGITARNRVKVWLNANFAVNRPEAKQPGLQSLDPSIHEREMIQNIFDLINSKADPNSTWRQLTHARETRQILTFNDALLLISEFVSAHKLSIPCQVNNPFNKNLFNPKDDFNSEIDKLEDLRNRSMEAENNKNVQVYTAGDRRVGSNLHVLKSKLVGGAVQERGRERERDMVVRENRYQPFMQIERNSRVNTEGDGTRPVTYSPAVVLRPHSPSSTFQIKFNYQGQSQPQAVVRTNPLNMISPATLAQQVTRSASESRYVVPTRVSYQERVEVVSNSVETRIEEKPQIKVQEKEETDQTIIENLPEELMVEKPHNHHQQQLESESSPPPKQYFAEVGDQSQAEVSIKHHLTPVREEHSPGHLSEQASPTFKMPQGEVKREVQVEECPPEAEVQRQSFKEDNISSSNNNKDIEINVVEPEVESQKYVNVEKGTSLKEIVIAEPYNEGHDQKFFKMKEVNSINTEGTQQSSQSFSKYADIFPEARKATSINEKGVVTSSFKQKKQNIQRLDKIEELNSHIGMTDSQELNSPVAKAKTPKNRQSKASEKSMNMGSIEQSSREVKRSIDVKKGGGVLEGKKSGIMEGKKSGIMEGKKSGIMEGKKSGMYDSKPKISKVSYKDMRKMLLETMQSY